MWAILAASCLLVLIPVNTFHLSTVFVMLVPLDHRKINILQIGYNGFLCLTEHPSSLCFSWFLNALCLQYLNRLLLLFAPCGSCLLTKLGELTFKPHHHSKNQWVRSWWLGSSFRYSLLCTITEICDTEQCVKVAFTSPVLLIVPFLDVYSSRELSKSDYISNLLFSISFWRPVEPSKTVWKHQWIWVEQKSHYTHACLLLLVE